MNDTTRTAANETREIRIDAVLEARYEKAGAAWTLKATRVMGGEWRRRNSVSRTMRSGGAPRMVTPADGLWSKLEAADATLTPAQTKVLARLRAVSEPGGVGERR